MKKTIMYIFILVLIFNIFTNSVFAQSATSNVEIQNNINTQMARGARGNSVCALQKILIARGFLNIPKPTCYFGSQTVQAVKAFQNSNGIFATGLASGRVGPATLKALNTPSSLDQNNTINTNTTSTNQFTESSNTNTNITSTPINPPLTATSKTESNPPSEEKPSTIVKNTFTCNSPSLSVNQVFPNAGNQIIGSTIYAEIGKIQITPSSGCKIEIKDLTFKINALQGIATAENITMTFGMRFYDAKNGSFINDHINNTFTVIQRTGDTFLQKIVPTSKGDKDGNYIGDFRATIEEPVILYVYGQIIPNWGGFSLPENTILQASLISINGVNLENKNEVSKVVGLPIDLNKILNSSSSKDSSAIKSGGVIGPSIERPRKVSDELAYINFSADDVDLPVNSVSLSFPQKIDSSRITNMSVSLIDPNTGSTWGSSSAQNCFVSDCTVTFNTNVIIPAGTVKKIKVVVNSTYLEYFKDTNNNWVPLPIFSQVVALNNLLINPVAIANVKYKKAKN